MQFVLGAVIVLCSTYIGIGLSSYYKKRLLFFREIINLIDKICASISYKRDTLKELLKDFKASNELNDFLNVLITFIENNDLTDDRVESIFQKSKLLKIEEKAQVSALFNLLGKSDKSTQIEHLKGMKEIFNKFLVDADIEMKKYSSLYLKLGFFFGCAVFIFII